MGRRQAGVSGTFREVLRHDVSSLAKSGRKPCSVTFWPSARSRSSSVWSSHAPAVSSASTWAPSAITSVPEATCTDSSRCARLPMPRAVQDPDNRISAGLGCSTAAGSKGFGFMAIRHAKANVLSGMYAGAQSVTKGGSHHVLRRVHTLPCREFSFWPAIEDQHAHVTWNGTALTASAGSAPRCWAPTTGWSRPPASSSASRPPRLAGQRGRGRPGGAGRRGDVDGRRRVCLGHSQADTEQADLERERRELATEPEARAPSWPGSTSTRGLTPTWRTRWRYSSPPTMPWGRTPATSSGFPKPLGRGRFRRPWRRRRALPSGGRVPCWSRCMPPNRA